jgi:hypothetical protein
VLDIEERERKKGLPARRLRGHPRRPPHSPRAELIEIEAESYRLKEAKELNAARSRQRRGKKH